MILRLSEKLAAKIDAPEAEAMALADDPLTDFTARLFTVARTQYVLVSNTASLYSVLLPGRGMRSPHELIIPFLRTLEDQLAREGFTDAYQTRIAPGSGAIVYGKALSRSVTGSMNDQVVQAKRTLADGIDLDASADILNGMPLFTLIDARGRYAQPREALRRLIVRP